MDSKFEFDLESMKNEISYDAVYRVINEKRQSSKQYLKDAIEKTKCAPEKEDGIDKIIEYYWGENK